MSSSQFIICDLIHTLTQHHLKLASTCTISLSTNPDVLESSYLSRLSSPPTVQTLWAFRGAGLRVTAAVKLDGLDVDGKGTEVFVEQLGLAIRDAELWSQLGLRASLTLSVGEHGLAPDSGRFDIHLTYTAISEGSTTLLEDAAVASTKPPDGVPCANLNEVHITWVISKTAVRLPIKRRKSSKPQNTGGVNDDELLLQSDNDDNRTFISPSQPIPRIVSLWDPETARAWSSSQPPVVTNFDEILDDEESDHALTTPNLPSTHSPFREPKKTQPQLDVKVNRKRAKSDPTSNLPDFSTSLKLFDASLRYMICDKTVRTSPGVRLQDRSTGPKLAEICPALFSPGYLQAMSQRNKFISTIAHSMAAIYGRSTCSTLKSTFTQLPLPGLSVASGPDEPRGDIPKSALISALKARLWLTAQKQLYDPKAAQRLKPLTYSGPGTRAALAGIEMLDEPSSPGTTPSTPNDPGPPWLDLMNDLQSPGAKDEEYLDDLEVDTLLDDYGDALLDTYSADALLDDDETILGSCFSDEVDLLDDLLRHADQDDDMLSQGLRSLTLDGVEILDDGSVDAETSSMLDSLSAKDVDLAP